MNHAPFDVTKFIPSKRIKAITEGFVVMEEESKKIVLEKKEVLRREGIEGVGNGKDLMTLLLKSNVGEGAKMSDAELQGQMTVSLILMSLFFLFAESDRERFARRPSFSLATKRFVALVRPELATIST